METEPVILISSDDEEDWLSELLDRVNQEPNNFDDVVEVDENVALASTIHKHKFAPSNGLKGSGADSDDDCLILDGDPDKLVAVADDTGNGTDDLQIVGEKGQVILLRLFSFVLFVFMDFTLFCVWLIVVACVLALVSSVTF